MLVAGRRCRRILIADLPSERCCFVGRKQHPHAALGIEHRRRIATTDVDVTAQRPRFAVWSGSWPSRPLRGNKTLLPASGAVGFHIERRDMHARRRIGTGNGRQPFHNRRAAASITLCKEIADHAHSPDSRPATASLTTICSLLGVSPCLPCSACELTTERKCVGTFLLGDILTLLRNIGVVDQYEDARLRRGFQSYEFEIRRPNFSYISIIELLNRSIKIAR